ncbi:histidine kinase, partial [Streptomyces sp. SID8455]|nr:histidine kinase [Streptomyces sp. SID8455]
QEAERLANGKAAFDRIRVALENQQERLRADRIQARADLESTITQRNWVFGTIALLIAVLAALVFEGLRRGINRPLELLGSDARIIAAGDFDHPITPTGPADLRQ